MNIYARWLAEAHEVRANRNNLIHGRWGVDCMNNQVVNVVGLPTGKQLERRYIITELKEALVRMEQLHTQLDALRKQWPI